LKIKEFFKRIIYKKSKGLLILDDILPSSLSPWRSNEYAELCSTFEHTKIFTDCTTYNHYNQNKSYEENLSLLTSNYPSLKHKIFILKKKTNTNYDLGYTLFYNNLIKFYPFFEKNKTNFAFTLYPGGGFGFNNKQIDTCLREICQSNYFKGVIVNQNITKKYLIENNICEADKIKLIFGVPLNLNLHEIKNYTYKKPSDCLNILFFANKYTLDGSDKGFDVFLKIVKQLLYKKETFNFIVIGGFSENDVTDIRIKNLIDFKGSLNEFEFNKIVKETHILISANKPFILSENAFDGFPLATCVTASLYGNLNFMTDYFNEAKNINLKDEEDFILIKHDIDDIVTNIIELDKDRVKLQEIAENGRNKMLHLYSFENQILPRLEFFKNLLF
jgi:glycosyltransferase involved in cell wall biosynthesis